MIKTRAGALRAIRECQTAAALRDLWMDISRAAWNDGGAIRAAYDARRAELSWHGPETNDEGLTWPEWAAAAGCDPAVTGTLRDEWRTGVDPTEYRANPAKRDLLAAGAGAVLMTPSDGLDFERRWLAECRAHGEAKRAGCGVRFTHAELKRLYDAMGQYIDNHDDPSEVDVFAVEACQKLEAYFAGLAEAPEADRG